MKSPFPHRKTEGLDLVSGLSFSPAILMPRVATLFPRRSPGRQAPLPADQALPLRPRPRPQGRARIGPFEMRWRELTWVHCRISRL